MLILGKLRGDNLYIMVKHGFVPQNIQIRKVK